MSFTSFTKGTSSNDFYFSTEHFYMNTETLHNPQLQQLEKDFINWLHTIGYSPATVSTRSRNIKEFLLYLENCSISSVEQVSNNKLKKYVRHLKQRENKLFGSGLMNASINVGISTVNKFFEYLAQSKKINIAPNKLEYEEENYKPRNILTIKEINALYEATFIHTWFSNEKTKTQQNAIQQRDRAMLGIYYGCGLRKSEGINLRTTDILTERKIIFVRKGKGGKERYVPVTVGNFAYITEYLQDGRNVLLAKSGIATDIFFISQYGEPCSDQSLSNRLDRLDKRAGINKKPTLHTLRHSISTHLLQQGMAIEMIQQFLGHASLESTQIYTHILNEL